MKSSIEKIAQSVLFCLPPEAAHTVGLKAIKFGLGAQSRMDLDERLKVRKAGLTFDNPLGIAAGFDKNAEVPDQMIKMGFGFAEVGTITPLAQAGNPKPRIFRLAEHQGVINRLGFNNQGAERALTRLQNRVGKSGLVGVNIGANKLAKDRVADYAWGVERFYEVAGYFTVNISSPNTPGLRDLQSGGELKALIEAVDQARQKMSEATGKVVPTFLKIAPDMDVAQLAEIVNLVKVSNFEGMVVSNTTINRDLVKGHVHAAETGGLSGRPLFEHSTALIAHARKLLGSELLLIGVGGVTKGQDVVAKMQAGADVVQVYSGFIYQGSGLICEAVKALRAHCDAHGLSSVQQITSDKVDEWCARLTSD